MLYGVDVHARYQGGLDIGLLARQGYSFLATKLSQGLWIPSSGGLSAAAFLARALSWLTTTREQQMIPGAYHWIDGSATGAEQARFFYGLVRQAGGPEGMLIQLDNEDVSAAPATWQHTADWAAEWEQLTGGHPFLMYTGSWWWRPRGWDGASLTPYLWDSHYLTADTDTIPDDPAAFAARIPASWWRLPHPTQPGVYGYGGWQQVTILQFSSRGDAGSLGNNVDLNATRLTREQLLTLTRTTGDDSMDMTTKVVTGGPGSFGEAMIQILARTNYLANTAGLAAGIAELKTILTEAADMTHPTYIDTVTQQRIADIAAKLDTLPAAVIEELAARVQT